MYFTICQNESKRNFFHTWPLHNLIVLTFGVTIKVDDIQLKSIYKCLKFDIMNKTIKFTWHTLGFLITFSVIGNIMFQLFPTLHYSSTHSFMILFDLWLKKQQHYFNSKGVSRCFLLVYQPVLSLGFQMCQLYSPHLE